MGLCLCMNDNVPFDVRFEAKDSFTFIGKALVGFFVICDNELVEMRIWGGKVSFLEIEGLVQVLHMERFCEKKNDSKNF